MEFGLRVTGKVWLSASRIIRNGSSSQEVWFVGGGVGYLMGSKGTKTLCTKSSISNNACHFLINSLKCCCCCCCCCCCSSPSLSIFFLVLFVFSIHQLCHVRLHYPKNKDRGTTNGDLLVSIAELSPGWFLESLVLCCILLLVQERLIDPRNFGINCFLEIFWEPWTWTMVSLINHTQ